MSDGLTSAEVDDLFRRYGFFLRRRCLVLLRNQSHADDAVQDVFLKVLKSGASIRSADHPLRWLHRVTDRACFDQLRRTKHTRRAMPIDDIAGELPCHGATTPELRDQAVRLLDALDDEDQTIAVMAFVDGMTQREIAEELGYSRTTIVNRVAHIRERAERTTRERS